MIITKTQYNTVINGLRTQLELLRAENEETANNLISARATADVYYRSITELTDKVQDLETQLKVKATSKSKK